MVSKIDHTVIRDFEKGVPMATMNVRGLDLYYETGGAGPALLLLSGAANVVDWYRPAFEHLGRERTYVAFDYPGCGRSARAEAVSIPFLADCAFELMERLGHDRFSVVGLSMGGIVTQRMLVRRSGSSRGNDAQAPERTARIERAVLFTSGPARLPEGAGPALRRTLHSDEPELAPAERVRASAPAIFTPEFLESPRFAEWLAWQEPLAADPEVLGQYVGAGLEHDVAEPLAHVGLPVLIVSASGDRLVPLSVGEELAATIPFSQHLVLRGSSHGLIYEYPAYSARVILDFLRADLRELPHTTAEAPA